MGYEFDFSAIFEQIGLLASGAGLTLLLTALTATIGIALSIAGAATSRWGLGWARRLVAVYVEIIRNTPFIVQLFFIFFGLPSLAKVKQSHMQSGSWIRIDPLRHAVIVHQYILD